MLIWHLQVQALRCLARGGAHTPFVVWVPCVTLTLLLPHLSPPGHPESLDVPRGHQHELDMWLPTLASPTHGTGVALSRLGFWCFMLTSLVTLERCLPGPKLEKHHLRLLTIPLSL